MSIGSSSSWALFFCKRTVHLFAQQGRKSNSLSSLYLRSLSLLLFLTCTQRDMDSELWSLSECHGNAFCVSYRSLHNACPDTFTFRRSLRKPFRLCEICLQSIFGLRLELKTGGREFEFFRPIRSLKRRRSEDQFTKMAWACEHDQVA